MTGEVRGCAPAENAYEVPNRIGCGRDDGADKTVFCLCGTDLCNGASRLSADVLPWSMTKLTLPLALLMLNFLILRTFPYSWRPKKKITFLWLFLFSYVIINVCTISLVADSGPATNLNRIKVFYCFTNLSGASLDQIRWEQVSRERKERNRRMRNQRIQSIVSLQKCK